MKINPAFKCNKGHISIRIKKETHKFCGFCAYRMRDHPKFLQKHFNKQHSSEHPYWLKHGDLPPYSCYDNFDDYL